MAKGRLLVVDDDAEIRSLLVTRLGASGYEVAEAADGPAALAAVRADAPDLLILDVMMPAMSGWEVARDLRRDPRTADVKILVLTAIGKSMNDMTSPLHGADAHMNKPFELAALEQLIEDLIG